MCGAVLKLTTILHFDSDFHRLVLMFQPHRFPRRVGKQEKV